MVTDKNSVAAIRSGPFDLHCHATLGEFDLVKINRSFRSLALAQAMAATLVICLTPKSSKLVKGGQWIITNRDSGRVDTGRVRQSRSTA